MSKPWMWTALLGLLVACSSEDVDGFPVRAPNERGMDATVLEGAREYAFRDGKNTQGVVVVRRGAIVAEWYAEGSDKDSWAASWSIAKSVTSALIGIAIDEGLIPSTDVSMADYFPEWRDTPREAIHLHHVLDMSTGRAWTEDYDPSDGFSDIIVMVTGESDQLAFATMGELEHEPGTHFNYSSADTLLLSGVLEAVTGQSAGAYADEKLFAPLDIDQAEWWTDAEGHTLTYCCLDTRSRDFAKFGWLYLENGQWDGQAVVPADWVAASLEPSDAYQGYGYKFWLLGEVDSRLPPDTYAGLGHDGQKLYIIPSAELVVVRSGRYIKDPGPPIADPYLFSRYPSDGYGVNRGTFPPDSWDDAAFLLPILDSIVD
jgi:CubicO group peptidase (beta-lactamase class C family)